MYIQFLGSQASSRGFNFALLICQKNVWIRIEYLSNYCKEYMWKILYRMTWNYICCVFVRKFFIFHTTYVLKVLI
jgi:hypothetical protein